MRSRLPAPPFATRPFATQPRATWLIACARLACAGFAVVLGSAAARGQSAAVLGKDDAAFARELYRRGFADMAESLCNTIEKSGKVSPEAEVGVKALHLDLRLDLARNEADPIKRKGLIKTILQEKEDLIHQFPTSNEAEEAGNSLPDVYRALGEAITAAIQKETDVGLVAQLQKEGEQFYSQAEEKLKARIEEMAEDHSTPEKERVYVGLLYNLPRTFYYHSLLYPAGEWKKKDLLEKAIQGFQQFGLDWQDTLLNYEGLVFMGLADKDLGKSEDALGDFDDAIKLAERFDADAKGVYQTSPEAADTISGAVLQKVLYQTELKDYAGAAATAKKYFATIPDPYQTRLGLAIRAAQADAELAAGDAKAAGESAQKLVELDERGRWGSKGREIQAKLLGGGGGIIDASNTLKVATSMAGRGEGERALEICRQAIAAAQGTPKEASVGVEGYLLIGSIFSQRGPGWYFESALAYDIAADRWPKAEKAPEATYQAMLAYLRIYGDDKRPWFKRRADERQKTLSTLYPNHPRAAYAQLANGLQLEREGKFLEAAQLYQQIPPGTASYFEAQYLAGNAYFQQAYKLCQEKNAGEAGQYVKQAETLLKKAKDDLEGAVQSTMDLEARARYDGAAFKTRAALAQMYLMDCVNRPADVLKILEGVDERYAGDADKLAAAWGFRISALEKQGKLDEAVALLDSLAKKDPESRAIGPAAGQVARALDKRAEDLQKQGKARESDEQLKRAAAYYALSGRALAKSGTARASDIDVIADRLFALGLHFNEMPAGTDSFVGWSASKTRETNLWKDAEELYTSALQLAPSYQDSIKLGRVLGLLGRFADAAVVYGRLFDSEPIIDPQDPDHKKFNNALLRQKAELYFAYLEWGVAAEESAAKDGDQELFVRAGTVFDNLVRTNDPGALNGKVYWYAKYHQIRNLMAQGKYSDAAILMRDIERTNSELGTPAGLQNEFKALKADLAKKVFDSSSPAGTSNGAKQNTEKRK